MGWKDDNIRLTFKDLTSLLLFTSSKFHLVLPTGTLTPSAKLVIKLFCFEERENSKLKPEGEMSGLVLHWEEQNGCRSVKAHAVGKLLQRASADRASMCTELSLYLHRQGRAQEIHRRWHFSSIFWIFFLHLFISHVCMFMNVHMPQNICEDQQITSRSQFSPAVGSWGLIWGHLAWQQTPLCFEQFPQFQYDFDLDI